MSSLVTKSFKVDADAWGSFLQAAKTYGATPAELLRELVMHVDAAVKGIQSGRITSFDGDVARLIRTEFPQVSPFQLQMMANVLAEAARISVDSDGKGDTEPVPKK